MTYKKIKSRNLGMHPPEGPTFTHFAEKMVYDR